MNPFLATDGYKLGHHKMYPEGTTLVYSNFTPRSNKYAPKGCDKVVSFGQQMVMKQIKEMFDKNFFIVTPNSRRDYPEQTLRVKNRVCNEIKEEYSTYLGENYDVSHIEALWDLGYLPIKVKALPEGTLVPVGVPVLTIVNTKPEFFWLTNFLETLISNLLWKPMTSATIGYQFKKQNDLWVEKTDKGNEVHKMFGCHDFSMRGMDSIDATISSGLGHAVSFHGSDSLPVIHGARKYYNALGNVVSSVNATEHSVMCAGTKGDEIGTFRYLMKQFPTGILSIVSDTWDLWKVLTEYLPTLKEEILARDGKIVIRPDSGDPVDIICGNLNVDDLTGNEYITDPMEIGDWYNDQFRQNLVDDAGYGECGDASISQIFKFKDTYYKCTGYAEWNRHDKQYYFIEELTYKVEKIQVTTQNKGVIELLWDLFGGTVNEQGYKVLNPKIGAIYGDSINLERFEEINKRLEVKGFASTNWVAGIGSFTYQFNTRDTFGFAMKATYCEVRRGLHEFEAQDFPQEVIDVGYITEGRKIFKDPITDDGTKKSAKGLLLVNKLNSDYRLIDQCNWESEGQGFLQVIFEDGVFKNETTFKKIRSKLNQ